MITRPRADITADHGGFSAHYGCPDPEMRTIASWLLTYGKRQATKVSKTNPCPLEKTRARRFEIGRPTTCESLTGRAR